MYLLLCSFVMTCFDFCVTIISPRKCSLHEVSIFTAEHVLSRILGFDMYTVSVSLVDAT
jgi:hypothetical protein